MREITDLVRDINLQVAHIIGQLKETYYSLATGDEYIGQDERREYENSYYFEPDNERED